MKIEYHENDKKKGIKYDFSLIRKEFKRLKIPKDVYNPLTIPLEWSKFNVLLSPRSKGKTTNILLLGLIFNKLYGTVLQYIRSSHDMVTPSKAGSLFSVIQQNGYIEKLTDGKYNSIKLHWGSWYYTKVDDKGEVIEQSEEIMKMLSIDRAEKYKSSYNAPNGDFIIFDEFIGKYYYPNEFVRFLDLFKTIQRDRISPIIFMLANTIDRESEYFNELEIYEEIHTLEMGEDIKVTTDKGTPIYIAILNNDDKLQKKQKIQNSLFYGFKNPQISSITGTDWAHVKHPHLPDNRTNDTILCRRHYIKYSNRLINLELRQCDELGIYIYAHKATRLYDDSIIYTNEYMIEDRRHRFLFGHTKMDKHIFTLYNQNKFYYQNNTIGSQVNNYIQTSKKI